MRDENELRDGLRDLADDYQVPDGLQDRVARTIAARRLRNRSLGALAATAASVALVAAVAIGAGNDDAGRRITTDRTAPTRTTTSAERATTSSTEAERSTSTTEPAPAATTVPPTIPLPTTSAPKATTTTIALPLATCPVDANQPSADLDGDGINDVVWTGWIEAGGALVSTYSSTGNPAIAACLSGTGRFTALPVDVHENTQLVDLNDDGRSEILVGGSTAGMAEDRVVTTVGDELVFATGIDGSEVVLTSGVVFIGEDLQPSLIGAYGCKGTGYDKVLGQIAADLKEPAMRWDLVTHRLEGTKLMPVAHTSGTEPPGTDVSTVADRLLDEC